MLCNKCGSDQHEERDCGAIGAGTGGPGGDPPDEDLAALGGGKPWSRLKKAGVALGALAIVGLAIGGIVASRDGKPAAKAGKAVATATAPTGHKVTLGCTITEVTEAYVEARCEWAKDGGVSFADMRWDGDVLKGTLVVTLTDGRVYRSAEEMVVKAQKAKTPVTFLAQK